VVQLFFLPFSPLVIQSPFSNMSATSASTSTSVGKCVVCGKETWMRCSACSEAGLDWMWFCSGEHQKLVSTIVPHIELDLLLTSSKQVWPVHKLVCNRYGNPFRWPGFSQAEADEILHLRHEGGITVKKGRPVTLEESCRVPSYELKKGETFDGLFEVSLTPLTILSALRGLIAARTGIRTLPTSESTQSLLVEGAGRHGPTRGADLATQARRLTSETRTA